MALYSTKELTNEPVLKVQYHGDEPTRVELFDLETGKSTGKVDVKKGDVLELPQDKARQLIRMYGYYFTLEGDKPLPQTSLKVRKKVLAERGETGDAAPELPRLDAKGNKLFTDEEIDKLAGAAIKAQLSGWRVKYNPNATDAELRELLREQVKKSAPKAEKKADSDEKSAEKPKKAKKTVKK